MCNRDDLVGELSRERSAREQLEKEVDQLLGGGLAAAIEEKEEELEASTGTNQYMLIKPGSRLMRVNYDHSVAVSPHPPPEIFPSPPPPRKSPTAP